MTTQLNTTHYPYSHHRPSISPPVSPKTQPHGYKRKASTQDDDALEPPPSQPHAHAHAQAHAQAHISNSFKKLRLSEHARQGRISIPQPPPSSVTVLQPNEYTDTDTTKPATAINLLDLSPVGISYRDTDTDTDPDPSFVRAPISAARTSTYAPHAQRNDDEEEADRMPLDDTPNRVWIHDLDAEIRQIEAEEREHATNSNYTTTHNDNNSIHILETGGVGGQDYYTKVPHHILRQGPKVEDPAAGLQMVLYRDPVSISVPVEEDAVRKAIAEARRRVREKQYGGNTVVEANFDSVPSNSLDGDMFSTSLLENDAVDDMDID